MTNEQTLEMVRELPAYRALEEQVETKQLQQRQRLCEQIEQLEQQLSETGQVHQVKLDAAQLLVDEARQQLEQAKQQHARAACEKAEALNSLQGAMHSCRRELARLLPGELADTLADLQQAAAMVRSEVRSRTWVVSGWEGYSQRETSNVDEISRQTAAIAATTRELEAMKTQPLTTGDILRAVQTARKKYRLDNLPKRVVNVKYY